MQRRVMAGVLSSLLAVALMVAMAPASTASSGDPVIRTKADLINYINTHGYLPLKGLKTLRTAKAAAARFKHPMLVQRLQKEHVFPLFPMEYRRLTEDLAPMPVLWLAKLRSRTQL